MPNGDPRDGFFYLTHTLIIHSYSIPLMTTKLKKIVLTPKNKDVYENDVTILLDFKGRGTIKAMRELSHLLTTVSDDNSNSENRFTTNNFS